jgi:hypothetical protein
MNKQSSGDSEDLYWATNEEFWKDLEERRKNPGGTMTTEEVRQAVVDQETKDKLATAMLDYHDRIIAIVDALPDDQVKRVVEMCRREGGITESHNFEMPEWTLIASLLESELGMRTLCREAEAYMKRTGESYYCARCRGRCLPDHIID